MLRTKRSILSSPAPVRGYLFPPAIAVPPCFFRALLLPFLPYLWILLQTEDVSGPTDSVLLKYFPSSRVRSTRVMRGWSLGCFLASSERCVLFEGTWLTFLDLPGGFTVLVSPTLMCVCVCVCVCVHPYFPTISW